MAGKLPYKGFRWLSRLRQATRARLFHWLRRLAATDDARAVLVSSLRNLLPRRPVVTPELLQSSPQPYADLGKSPTRSGAALRQDTIFITARFRSGSTLLWNIFRHVGGCTAYYEPFNERRWFDPATRGCHADPTHRHADAYWREYDGLEVLGNYYQERWIDRDLFMDAQSWDPDMKRYVETLIDRAPGRPVLQFNRIDFRLPWFRHHFPSAKIIHLYRHPRDQWCSTLGDPAALPRTASMADFARRDYYYVRRWARDLADHFPFLEEGRIEHPYRMFYLIWKLSYLFGRAYAHHSLAFEDLVDDAGAGLAGLFRMAGVRDTNLGSLRQLVEKPRVGRWREYADEKWFRGHETHCEAVIADFFPHEPTATGGAAPPTGPPAARLLPGPEVMWACRRVGSENDNCR
jgi:hypothetical protein